MRKNETLPSYCSAAKAAMDSSSGVGDLIGSYCNSQKEGKQKLHSKNRSVCSYKKLASSPGSNALIRAWVREKYADNYLRV